MRTGVWEPVYICSGKNESEPRGRYRHELAFDGKMIYVLGGGTSADAYGFLVNKYIYIYIYIFYLNNVCYLYIY
jgi:hypothetical protein